MQNRELESLVIGSASLLMTQLYIMDTTVGQQHGPSLELVV